MNYFVIEKTFRQNFRLKLLHLNGRQIIDWRIGSGRATAYDKDFGNIFRKRGTISGIKFNLISGTGGLLSP